MKHLPEFFLCEHCGRKIYFALYRWGIDEPGSRFAPHSCRQSMRARTVLPRERFER